MRAWAIIAGVVMIPGVAGAQQSSKDVLASFGMKIVEPMTAKELAATRVRVDAELARSGTAALFENVSDANGGRARHRASGLVCPLGKKGQRVLAASMDQASCETRDGSTVYKTKVERAPEGATLDTVAAKALTDAQKEPGYAASGGVSVTGHPRPGSGLPDHQTLRFLSRIDGHERASRLQIGVVRGWVLTERRETPNTNAQPSSMSEILSEATFGTSMTAQQ
ncbi:hypothetical protein FHS94_003652 [Sphingomonas aerophila]|uniref:Uncharacterized protein n=1 Tax=Sphingomonas aerophila TaxID=1344948 RepID=A0A7W9EW04_9SPHN|nr:hypothetical protein [Sphingomonas aerophila]